MHTSEELDFEMTIQLFLGDKASNIAGQVSSQKHRREWLTKALRLVAKRIHELDTTTRHKEALVSCAERALRATESQKISEAECSVTLLRLIGQLAGFTGGRGAILCTPVYYQTAAQHYTEAVYEGGDAMQDYYDEKNAIAVRKRLITQLKSEGLGDFQISLILNTSEYQIKELRKEL